MNKNVQVYDKIKDFASLWFSSKALIVKFIIIKHDFNYMS